MDGVGDEVMGEGDEVYMGDREEGVDGVGDEVVGEGDEVHMGDGEEGTNGKETQTSSDKGPNCFKIVKTRFEV